jgi:DNA mismatch endonuclease (patch repair protein)
MSRIRGRDTAPELALRRALWKEGVRFRVNVRDLPGRPDIASKKAKVAVFVDGCFWHGCPEHYRAPRTRRAYWEEKIRRNQERRRQVMQQYPPDWQAFEVFECVLGKDLPNIQRRVAKLFEARPSSRSRAPVPRPPGPR